MINELDDIHYLEQRLRRMAKEYNLRACKWNTRWSIWDGDKERPLAEDLTFDQAWHWLEPVPRGLAAKVVMEIGGAG